MGLAVRPSCTRSTMSQLKEVQSNMMRGMSSPRQESDSLDVQVLVDSIPALIHTGRPDGYLDYFNQRWLQYVGLPLENLLDWKWTAAIHSEDVESMVNRWRASIASGEAFLHEAPVRGPAAENPERSDPTQVVPHFPPTISAMV